MKRITPYVVAVIISIFITLFIFNAMSWYSFGDIPTKAVFIRIMVFFGVLSVLACIIVFFVMRKRTKAGISQVGERPFLIKKKRIILISVLIVLALTLLLLYLALIGGFYASSDKVVGEYTGTASIHELQEYEEWKIGKNRYGQPIFVDPQKAFDFLEYEFGDVIDTAYDIYHVDYNLGRLNKSNYSAYTNLIYQIPTENEELHHRYMIVVKFLDIYENSFKRWIYIPGVGWDRICP